jgi:hypothetical protein
MLLAGAAIVTPAGAVQPDPQAGPTAGAKTSGAVAIKLAAKPKPKHH